MGFSAVDIAGRMGHESIDITLHYAHMFPTAQKDMIEDIGKRMDVIEGELKRVASADALDMGKLAGVKALVELFEAVRE